MQLDEFQKKAVEHTGTPLLITAGPGSGKTRVITERVKFILNSGVNPSEILCLTFSEKAASEIRDRLESDLEIKGKIDISEMEISTYHAFCRGILLENVSATGISMKGGVMERSAFLVWGVQNIDQFGFDEHVVMVNNEFQVIEKMIDGISVFNQELISPEEIENYVSQKLSNLANIVDPSELNYLRQLRNLVLVYKKYVDFKKKIDVMDYDDLIVETNKILNENKVVREAVQKKFKHVLIDEFQDNNFAQFEIIKKIHTEGNVTAVGDPDQNIYSFQGAYRGIFDDFKQTFSNSTEIFLENNYRNTPNITMVSNQLLSQDSNRIPKNVVSTKKDSTLVKVAECSSEFAQVQYVINTIERKMQENPSYTFRDFAIFSRKQEHGMKIAERLVAEGIPVKYIGNAKMKVSSSAQIVTAFLKIISEPMTSMIPFVRILQHYDISEENIFRITREASGRARETQDGDGMFSTLNELNVSGLTQKKKISEIVSMINSFIKESSGKPPSHTLYSIIRNKTDIYKKIANHATLGNFVEMSVLNDMIQNAYDLEKINQDATISDFLKFQSMLATFDVETRRDEKVANAIQVSTIHKSKGLEFKVVFLVDIATNKIPMRFTSNEFYVPKEISRGITNQNNAKEEHLREERRILYVGMTRAIEDLHITYPTQYENSSRANKASKFVQALTPSNNQFIEFSIQNARPRNEQGEAVDRIESIRNRHISHALTAIQNGLYQSALKSIVDLARISHFKENETTDGFSHKDFLDIEFEDSINLELNDTVPQPLGYNRDKISFTRISDYQSCPKMFWYKYVVGALPENRNQPTLYKGDLFHRIVENSANKKIEGVKISAEEMVEQASTEWATRQYIGFSEQREKQDKESTYEALKAYERWDEQNPNSIVELEMKFSYQLGGYSIEGKIDRIEKNSDGEFEIVDYKTGGKNKVIENIHESLQLNIYAMALASKDRFGKLPKRASFFYPEKEGEQQFIYEVSEQSVKNAKRKIQEILESIDGGNFTATPNLKMCGWCDYKDICDESAS